MTVEPASTRANRINSDSLDWSYIAISLMVGHSTSVWRARGRSTADTPSAPTRLLKHSRQFRVPAVRAGQRPALARNDPLNICGNQREQILFIVGTYCCKEIFHNLNILFCAH